MSAAATGPLAPARFAALDALLAEALALDDDARAAFLARAARDQPDLADELRRLLALADAPGAWESALRDAGAQGRDALAALAVAAPARVGAWDVRRPIGRGGMADVFLAQRDQEGFAQVAALKILHTASSDPHAITRFEQERRILATLTDTRIARLYDGGVLPDGRPWTAMEYVDGLAIDAWCDARRLPVAARVRLVLALVGAVASAHRSLVVHRDIKPANVLVTADGDVKLLDFGIAKILQADAATTAMPWRAFTPQYAAPEQLLDGAVTTATDTWQLGLLLFELLVGRRPFQDDETTLPRLLRAVSDHDAVALDRAWRAHDDETRTALARARDTSVDRLARSLRGDLALIVAKALAREPAARYATVVQFGEDLQRWLDGRPVRAARPSAAYRARRFVARHRGAVAIAALAMLAVVAGTLGTAWQAREALHQRDQARVEAEKSERLLAFLIDAFAQADPTRTQGETVTARALLDRARSRIDDELPRRDAVRADLLAAMASAYAGLGLRRERVPLALEALAVERELARPKVLPRRLAQAAAALRDDTRAAEAVPLLDEAQALLRADPTASPGLIGHVLFLQGMTQFSLRDMPRSIALYEAAIATLRTAPDADPEDLRIARLMLSRRLVTAGRTAEGLALVEAAIADARAATPPQPAALLDALDAQGSAQEKLGRHDAQVATYREALALSYATYGPEHFNTAVLEHNYALALEHTGALAQALAHSREAVRIGARSVDEAHAFTLASTVALTRLRCENGDRTIDDAALDDLIARASRLPGLVDRVATLRARCRPPA